MFLVSSVKRLPKRNMTEINYDLLISSINVTDITEYLCHIAVTLQTTAKLRSILYVCHKSGLSNFQ